MHFSFQTFLVGAFVTAAHIGVLVAFKPASEEASKFFSSLETEAFVEEVLVKKGTESTPPETNREPVIAENDELQPEAAPAEIMDVVGVEELAETGKEVDIFSERDSVKAVTDVREFAGRIAEPSLINPVEEKPGEPAIGKKEAAPSPKKEVAPPKKTGPFELRAIEPVSRP
ncbi:MAG: hypothetical protein AAF733_04830 [Verrucomicrobiota bacterium]